MSASRRSGSPSAWDNAFPQLLLLVSYAHDASDRIYRAIVKSTEGEKTLLPIMRPYDPVGSTQYVDFDTARPVFATSPEKCHVSHVVLDSDWEAKMAETLEEMEEVECYVKNHNLGFSIPYTINGEEKNYYPDYIVRLKKADGEIVNLLVEVSGEPRKDKAAKVSTAQTLWVPAINNIGSFGKWDFIEISDPWDAKNTMRAAI